MKRTRLPDPGKQLERYGIRLEPRVDPMAAGFATTQPTASKPEPAQSINPKTNGASTR